jgi:predicted GH43/DUF377 family glycosyl hydrolase
MFSVHQRLWPCRLLALSLIVSQGSLQAQAPQALPPWAMGGFVRVADVNPVIRPDTTTRFIDPMTGLPVDWESNDTFNPGAVVKDGRVVLLYRSEDRTGVRIGHRTSRLGYAESRDGIRFRRRPEPVLFPADDDQKPYEWPGGCEDPRVAVTEDGLYVVFYTQWNRKVPRLGVATSRDLIHWQKHGPIFRKAHGGRFVDKPHKSASIVTTLKDGKVVITRINGKYWMYWGEHGVTAATSDNLVDWEPVLDEKGDLKVLVTPRKGYFDSHLTECGPPALLTEHGILLLYNGKNLGNADRDPRFHPNTYSAGQVLFSADDPARAIARLDTPFLIPTEDFERRGQYANGTVFIEGLVYHRKKWYLYYGCADSRVAVAVYDPAKRALPDPIPEPRVDSPQHKRPQ